MSFWIPTNAHKLLDNFSKSYQSFSNDTNISVYKNIHFIAIYVSYMLTERDLLIDSEDFVSLRLCTFSRYFFLKILEICEYF